MVAKSDARRAGQSLLRKRCHLPLTRLRCRVGSCMPRSMASLVPRGPRTGVTLGAWWEQNQVVRFCRSVSFHAGKGSWSLTCSCGCSVRAMDSPPEHFGSHPCVSLFPGLPSDANASVASPTISRSVCAVKLLADAAFAHVCLGSETALRYARRFCAILNDFPGIVRYECVARPVGGAERLFVASCSSARTQFFRACLSLLGTLLADLVSFSWGLSWVLFFLRRCRPFRNQYHPPWESPLVGGVFSLVSS